MDFSRRKLPKESLARLYRLPKIRVRPFTLMFTPVYLWLKANEKFVSIKAPLDFFTKEELQRYKDHRYFYLPECVATIRPYRETGIRLKRLLAPLNRATSQGPKLKESRRFTFERVALTPAPYELSNEVLRILGPLWWEYPDEKVGIEPFLVSALVNELCNPIPSEDLLNARDLNTNQYDRAILRSAWAVFMALHLGYYDLNFLNRLRLKAFRENATGTATNLSGAAANIQRLNELDELTDVAYDLISEDTRKITHDAFGIRPERVSAKLSDRLERIRRELSGKGENPPSIYGEGGFLSE